MAACMRREFAKKSEQFLRRFLKRDGMIDKYQRCTCSSDAEKSHLALFNTDEVQGILSRITGLDINKVFRHAKRKLEPPTYRLVSDAKLTELEEEAKRQARRQMQMPPVLEERQEIATVLSDNKELDGLDSSKFVFTDISYGVSDRERFIVVREPSGTLRKASWEERDRITQVYFPRAHREMAAPPMFEEENISVFFTQDRYEDLLNAACGQYEPDAADFIRVHHQVYDDVDAREKYDLLRSTRHFGGLAFYLVRMHRMDGMLADMIQKRLFSDAVDLIHLYHILYPECQSAVKVQTERLEEMDLIKAYIELDAKKQGRLELVLQAYENALADQDGTVGQEDVLESR